MDLNAIPASMIDHIEIVRDAAAAQYGSEAIAGVVTIVLKSAGPGDVTVQAGECSTKEPRVLNFDSTRAAGISTYHHSYNHDAQALVNAGATLASGAELYAFGGLDRRFGDAFGFWRRPSDNNNVRAIHPDGFLPEE